MKPALRNIWELIKLRQTYVLAYVIVIPYMIKTMTLPPEAFSDQGVEIAALLTGVAALIWGSKQGSAAERKAANGYYQPLSPAPPPHYHVPHHTTEGASEQPGKRPHLEKDPIL